MVLPQLVHGAEAPAARERAEQLLGTLGLSKRLDHRPSKLSGGEQQRVAVARALANRPPLVLADEPTGNLDSASGAGVLALLQELNAAGATVVIVTHDGAVAGRCPRQLELRDGRLTRDSAA